jgi:hypothetical protein
MPTHSLATLAVSLAELRHSPPQEFSSYLLELFHRQAMAAAAAAAAAMDPAAAGSSNSSSPATTSSGSSSRAGKGVSLTSHAASFVWALPRLLVGRASSQAAADSAAAADSGQLQQGKQGRRQRVPQQQQQGEVVQVQQAVHVSKAWLRQYCWLLQVGGWGLREEYSERDAFSACGQAEQQPAVDVFVYIFEAACVSVSDNNSMRCIDIRRQGLVSRCSSATHSQTNCWCAACSASSWIQTYLHCRFAYV